MLELGEEGGRPPLSSFSVDVFSSCTLEVGVEISRKRIVQHVKLLFREFKTKT